VLSIQDVFRELLAALNCITFLYSFCRRRIAYEKGLRTEKAIAGQAEINEMKKARQALKRQAQKAKKKSKSAENKFELPGL
jgi:hypothetical protein